MNKSLVLAMALSLGIAGTAFAANPFADVPANHWAYASVSKLAQAGIVDGYGDDTFRGGKSITRYEMAQMVAKAMAKADKADSNQKAMLEKLAAEFAVELDNLGVRLTKLENNADKVKVGGEMRFLYMNYTDKYQNQKRKGDVVELRTRLVVNGEINDKFSATAMLENTQNLKTNGRSGEESNTEFARAYVTGDIKGVKVKAGRFDYLPAKGVFFDDDMDGVAVSFGNKLKTTLAYGRMTAGRHSLKGQGYIFDDGAAVNTMGLEMAYQVNDKLGLKAAYFDVDAKNAKDDNALGKATINGSNIYDNKVCEVVASYAFDKNISIWAEYNHSKENFMNTGKDGWTASLSYKGVNAAQKGSWGTYLTYYDLPAGGMLSTTFDIPITAFGIKGFEVGGDYALAKNITMHLAYSDGKTKNVNGVDNLNSKMLHTKVQFCF